MSAALGSVSVSRQGSGYAVTCSRPGRADTRRGFTDRAQAVLHAGQMAAMMDLPLVQVGAEPEEVGAQ